MARVSFKIQPPLICRNINSELRGIYLKQQSRMNDKPVIVKQTVKEPPLNLKKYILDALPKKPVQKHSLFFSQFHALGEDYVFIKEEFEDEKTKPTKEYMEALLLMTNFTHETVQESEKEKMFHNEIFHPLLETKLEPIIKKDKVPAPILNIYDVKSDLPTKRISYKKAVVRQIKQQKPLVLPQLHNTTLIVPVESMKFIENCEFNRNSKVGYVSSKIAFVTQGKIALQLPKVSLVNEERRRSYDINVLAAFGSWD